MMQASLLVLAAFLFLPHTAQAQFWELKTPKSYPSARDSHALSYDAKRSVTVLFGGSDKTGPLGDTWQWNGSSWTQLKPATTPSARYSPAMAFDSSREKTVLFGGHDKTGNTKETWEWDGKTWTQLKPKLAPPAVRGPSMAYHPTRKSMILVVNDSGNQTWEWDGKDWTHLKPVASVPALTNQEIVFNAVRKTILLHGQSFLSPETWEWDGKTWTQLKPLTMPPMMDSFGMVYDDQRQKAHLWGNVTKSTTTESWEWNGQNWSQVKTMGAPGKRTMQVMAWDSARSRIVLFSGSNSIHDTWELHLHAQSIKSIGVGCPGSNKMTPTLAGNGDPKPGGIVSFQIEKALPLMPLVFVFGFDKVNFDLKAIGAPGCVLLANTHSLIPGQADLNGIWRTIGVRVPMNPVLVGGKYWAQVLAYDPKANSIGLTITNALETTIGY